MRVALGKADLSAGPLALGKPSEEPIDVVVLGALYTTGGGGGWELPPAWYWERTAQHARQEWPLSLTFVQTNDFTDPEPGSGSTGNNAGEGDNPAYDLEQRHMTEHVATIDPDDAPDGATVWELDYDADVSGGYAYLGVGTALQSFAESATGTVSGAVYPTMDGHVSLQTYTSRTWRAHFTYNAETGMFDYYYYALTPWTTASIALTDTRFVQPAYDEYDWVWHDVDAWNAATDPPKPPPPGGGGA